MLFAAPFGAPELLLILLIVLVLFGATILPRLARAAGQSKREFQQGMKESKGEEIPEP